MVKRFKKCNLIWHIASTNVINYSHFIIRKYGAYSVVGGRGLIYFFSNRKATTDVKILLKIY